VDRQDRCRRLAERYATAFYVLTLTGDQICAMTRFEASVLPWFGLPRSLPSR
jgi:RNA polymerase sigma-70 factor (ECF subfamily)